MKKPPRKYTHDELVEVLRRSIALDEAAKDHQYTEEDLAAAARELDVAPEMLAKARTELARRNAARALAPRPFDTRLELERTDERFRLRIPPQRQVLPTIGGLGFAGFWFAFLAFWTAGAGHASVVFACFSIPFWLAGFGLLRRVLLPVFQVTTLELGPEEGTIETRPLGGKTRLLRRELSVRAGRRKRTDGASGQEPVVVLDHGTKNFPLLRGYSDPERRWVLGELKAWLAAHEDGTP